MTARRPIRSAGLCRAAAIVVLAALTIGAPVKALHAKGPTPTPLHQIAISGTPRLLVEKPGGAGYDSAWVIFRTSTRMQVTRQVVTRVRDLTGRSYGDGGQPNCIRSTVIGGAKVVRPGVRYRVEFFVRKGRAGPATRLLATHRLIARRHVVPRGRVSPPRC